MPPQKWMTTCFMALKRGIDCGEVSNKSWAVLFGSGYKVSKVIRWEKSFCLLPHEETPCYFASEGKDNKGTLALRKT